MADQTDATNGGPLHGLRVVDFSNSPSGMQASQTLADFGAEVVLVEPPGGSPMRRTPGFPFIARGKRSIVLDLHDAADRATAQGLAAGADVVIETFRPGGRAARDRRRRAAESQPRPRVRLGDRLRPHRPLRRGQGVRGAGHGPAGGPVCVRQHGVPPRAGARVGPVRQLRGEPAPACRHPRSPPRTRSERARPAGRHQPREGPGRAGHVELVPPHRPRQVPRRLHAARRSTTRACRSRRWCSCS